MRASINVFLRRFDLFDYFLLASALTKLSERLNPHLRVIITALKGAPETLVYNFGGLAHMVERSLSM